MLEIGKTTRATAFWMLVAGAAGSASACGATVTLVGGSSNGGSGTGTTDSTASGVTGTGTTATGGTATGTSGTGATGTTTVTGTTTSTGTGPNQCPPSAPSAGSPCSDDGLVCSYAGAECGETVTCANGQWQVPSPPACICPTEVPAEGSACDPCCTESCSYAPPGQCGPSATCSPSGTWNVVVPPCVASSCTSITQPLDCQEATGCRWLVPACGQPSIFGEGCYDLADCDPSTGCSDGQSCVQVDTDPCWDSNCGTCGGGTADICYGPG